MKGNMKSALMEMTLKESDYERKSDLEKDFKFQKKFNDPRFGEISLIQNPSTRQFLAVKDKRINDKKETGKVIVNARKKMTNNNPYILSLIDYSVAKQAELCSSFYLVRLFYDFPRSDLYREMQEREKNGQSFDDIELTHILYQTVQANSYLQSKGQYHGNIQPVNVAYKKTEGVAQLIDMSEDANTQNQTKALQKNRLIAGLHLYQSPTTFANLKKGNLNYSVDPNKEDVFALGLTLLEIGNGKSIQNIYSNPNKEVDLNNLNTHLTNFKAKHGADNALLVSTVDLMLSPDEAKRPNFTELETSLPPYDAVKQQLIARKETKSQGFATEDIFKQYLDADWDFEKVEVGNYDFFESTEGISLPQTENIKLLPLPITNFGVKPLEESAETRGFSLDDIKQKNVKGGFNLPIREDRKRELTSIHRDIPVHRNFQNATKGNQYANLAHDFKPTLVADYHLDKVLSNRMVYQSPSPSNGRIQDNAVRQNQGWGVFKDNNRMNGNVAQPNVEVIQLPAEYRREYITDNVDRRMNANNQIRYQTNTNADPRSRSITFTSRNDTPNRSVTIVNRNPGQLQGYNNNATYLNQIVPNDQRFATNRTRVQTFTSNYPSRFASDIGNYPNDQGVTRYTNFDQPKGIMYQV